MLYDQSIDPPAFAFNIPATVDAIKWYTALTQAQGVKPLTMTSLEAPQQAGMNYNQRSALINAGRAAMWTMVFGIPEPLYKLPSGLQTSLVPLPLGMEGAAVMDSMFTAGYYISASTPNPQACWAWLRYLTEQPDAVQGVPARRSVAESAQYREKIGAKQADVLVPLVANYTPPADDQLLLAQPWLNKVRPWWEESYGQIVSEELNAEEALSLLQTKATAYRTCVIQTNAFADEAQQQACIEQVETAQ